MATSTGSLQLVDLPDDILLEILAYLPAFSVVLHCRRVCSKLNKLSREQHLLIGFFNRTKYTLRQPTELKQLGTPEFERSICRAETLERIWSDEGALSAVPRFWREIPRRGTTNHGSPVSIMGEYIIFWQSHAYSEQQRFTWVPVCDWNGPAVLQVTVELCFPNIESYMDISTGIFYIIYPSESGLQVAGFRADSQDGQPREVIHYPLQTRRKDVRPLELRNGLLCLDYGFSSDNSKVELDVVDLKRGILFQVTLPHLASLFPQDALYLMHSGLCVIATETHLICVSVTGRTTFAVFGRPAIDQGIQLLSTGAPLPAQEPTYLIPVLVGKFPFYLNRLWVMPRSATSFVIVGIRQIYSSDSNESTFTIHTFFFNVSEGKSSFEEIGSLVVPGTLKTCILRSPPPISQYALGVLSIFDTRDDPDEKNPGKFRRKHFALRIDLPNPEHQDPASRNRCQIALTRMQLTPAVDEEREAAEFEYFDHFSGRAVMLVSSDTTLRTSVVLDYLSNDRIAFQ